VIADDFATLVALAENAANGCLAATGEEGLHALAAIQRLKAAHQRYLDAVFRVQTLAEDAHAHAGSRGRHPPLTPERIATALGEAYLGGPLHRAAARCNGPLHGTQERCVRDRMHPGACES